ncbi:MAG: protein kinase [Bacteroidota bacterium]
MTPERWAHIRETFETALALHEEARGAYLEETCQGDTAMLEEVQSLLQSEADTSPFLDTPITLETVFTAFYTEEMPVSIGVYRLLDRLGQGGMGTVFLVEQEDGALAKPLALKLLDQQRLVSRFEQEQHILRHLNHPGIARLIDAGFAPDALSSTGQRPYLVMEYVEGVPIDQYCNAHTLSVDARLQLFIQVCQAVQYAHENLVLHRDLKPSNILVEETSNGPKAKLLDFGIAKLLHPVESAAIPITRTGQYLLTPEYASPEQLRGAPIATTSDVYALGVLLYKVLTGTRPYEVQGKSAAEIEEVVHKAIPKRPSEVVDNDRFRRRLQGDLDTIVMKALRKEPGRRYRTVSDMAGDIQRHLNHLPVKARPVSLPYRFNKFIRRHRTGAIASFLIALTLLGGVISTGLQSRQVDRRSHQIRMLTASLLSDIDDAIRDLPGATKAREQLVATAVVFLDSLQQEMPRHQALQLEMANAYDQLARLQGDPHYSNLGLLSAAKKSYQKAYKIRQQLWLADSTDAALQHALAVSLGHMAVLESWTGDNNLAIKQSQDALRIMVMQRASDPTINTQYDKARIQSELGWWLIWGGRRAEGLVHLREAMQVLERIAPAHPDHLDLQLQRWRNYWYQTDGLKFTAQYQAAAQLLERKAQPHLAALAQRYPTNPRVQYGEHTVHYFLGQIYLALDDFERARAAYEASLMHAKEMIATDSTNQKAHMALAFGNSALGFWHFERGAYQQAIPYFASTVVMRHKLYLQDAENQEAANSLSTTYRILCRAYLLNEQVDQAAETCTDAIEYMVPVVEGNPIKGVLWGNQGFNYGWLARTYKAKAAQEPSLEIRTTYLTRALNNYDQSLAIMEKIFDQQAGDDNAWEFSLEALQEEHREVQVALR